MKSPELKIPINAWPSDWQKLRISSLIIREANSSDKASTNRLLQLRNRIDEMDEELMQLLGRRMAVVEQIGKYKLKNHITILQEKRWEEITTTRLLNCESSGISAEFIDGLFKLIHNESIRRQAEVMNIAPSELVIF